jgi:TfoX/Sxy family transcriptional regulator of competence genes
MKTETLEPEIRFIENQDIMAYSEIFAERIREMLVQELDVVEKKMMGGLCFMVNGKMCVGIVGDDLMARIAPEAQAHALTRKGCRVMDFTGRPMKGYVFVNPEGIEHNEDLRFWIGLALAFNPFAKASKKKT